MEEWLWACFYPCIYQYTLIVNLLYAPSVIQYIIWRTRFLADFNRLLPVRIRENNLLEISEPPRYVQRRGCSQKTRVTPEIPICKVVLLLADWWHDATRLGNLQFGVYRCNLDSSTDNVTISASQRLGKTCTDVAIDGKIIVFSLLAIYVIFNYTRGKTIRPIDEINATNNVQWVIENFLYCVYAKMRAWSINPIRKVFFLTYSCSFEFTYIRAIFTVPSL